jgi:hypothetical protein
VAGAHLATYLSEHFGGASAAVNLLVRLESVYPGSETARFIAALRRQVEEDRATLAELMQRLAIRPSRTRQAVGLVAAKIGQGKLRLDDRSRGPLFWLEALEVISLGISGKIALWRALNTAAGHDPSLQLIVDFRALEERAAVQRDSVELLRLEIATIAFRPGLQRLASGVTAT